MTRIFRLSLSVRILAGLLLATLGSLAMAQEGILGFDRPGLGLKTLGGRIEWTDQLVWSGWRIQQNSQDGRCRLLDPGDRRFAVGSFDYCITQLCLRRSSGQIASTNKHVVVLLHGLAGSRNYMGSMEQYLNDNGFEVVSFGYASTKGTIQELAVSLECVLRNLEGVEQVSFVAHSMGNIVIRHLLYRLEQSATTRPLNLTFCRLVMISPPNQAAYLADTIGQAPLIQSIFGPAVDQFAATGGWRQLEAELTIPQFEFGIIAGGRGNQRGYLARVPGDDDGLLAIDSHYLDGAADFIQIGGIHQLMPKYKSVQQATAHFLQHGRFRR